MRIFLALFLMVGICFVSMPVPASNRPESSGHISSGSPNDAQQGKSNLISQKDNDIRDIHGPLASDDRSFLPLLLAGASLLVLAGLFFFWKARRKIPAPSIPANLTALADLNSIMPLMNGDLALVYMEKAAGILRRYVEARFSILCTRKTSREFLQSLQSGDMATAINLRPFLSELQNCLELCDMAKFSHRLPEQAEITQVELVIRDFIEKTGEKPGAAGER